MNNGEIANEEVLRMNEKN